MPYTFENPEQTTFKAIKFNGQLFSVGRGLFIHITKYHPSIIEQQTIHSKSKTPFTLENFSKTTRAQKEWFKGLRFEYVDVDKKYREEIKACSKFGEGWWPGRSKLAVPGVDYPLSYSNFLMHYENGTTYFRRLGRGNNIPNEARVEYQSGVEFTRKGYLEAIKKYREITGQSVLFDLPLPRDKYGFYHLKQLSVLNPIPELVPADWVVWRIKNKKDREEFMKNAG